MQRQNVEADYKQTIIFTATEMPKMHFTVSHTLNQIPRNVNSVSDEMI